MELLVPLGPAHEKNCYYTIAGFCGNGLFN